jgi:hypothetical protein
MKIATERMEMEGNNGENKYEILRRLRAASVV